MARFQGIIAVGQKHLADALSVAGSTPEIGTFVRQRLLEIKEKLDARFSLPESLLGEEERELSATWSRLKDRIDTDDLFGARVTVNSAEGEWRDFLRLIALADRLPVDDSATVKRETSVQNPVEGLYLPAVPEEAGSGLSEQNPAATAEKVSISEIGCRWVNTKINAGKKDVKGAFGGWEPQMINTRFSGVSLFALSRPVLEGTLKNIQSSSNPNKELVKLLNELIRTAFNPEARYRLLKTLISKYSLPNE